MNDLKGEQRLRAAVHKQLLARARTAQDTLIVDELGVLHGQCRIDIAVINGHLRGIELKSEEDTLGRLPKQIRCYGSVVDCATLVVDEKLTAAALHVLPEWWGVVKVSVGNAAPRFTRLRPERANPNQRASDIARLLWKSEAIEVLQRITFSSEWQRKRRAELYDALAAALPLRVLRFEVRAALKKREHWRDHGRPGLGGGSCPPSAMWTSSR